MTKARAWLGLFLVACNVPVRGGSHGVPRDDAGKADAHGLACAGAVAVAESDYMSTNVGLLSLDGTVLTPSIASSATRAVGLSAPLSGDIVLPTMPVEGNLVLIDGAQGASRLVWVDPDTARKRELSVASGFWSNPHDYAVVAPGKAYVSRYNANADPGKAPFDAGNDVLIVDPSEPSILGSIDMTSALARGGSALPDADKIVVAGERAYVLLGALPTDFSGAQIPSRLVTIDTTKDAVSSTLVLGGLLDCAGLALSPDEKKLAVLCSGKKIDPNAPSGLDGSGVALVDITGEPAIAKQFAASDLGKGPVGFFAAFSSPTSLVVETFGFDDPTSGTSLDDTIVRLELASGTTDVVLHSAGEPFTLGGIVCDTACGACFVADAKRSGGIVHRFTVDDAGALSGDTLVKVETDPGLPPRYLGLLR